jgi:AraC-like DNA-binding protein
MTGAIHSEQDFTRRLTEFTEANLRNEQFGVSELAREMNMQRSTLHRKVKKIFSFSVSQFISHVRLKKALEILQNDSLTVSETAYECGFHSVTYFSKCFHDFYGFAPGAIKKQTKKNENQPSILLCPR